MTDTVDLDKCRAHLEARFRQRDERMEERRQAALAAIRPALRQAGARVPAVRKLFLFGSVLVPGAFRRDSDVDVGVVGELTGEDFWRLWRQVDKAAPGWEIDLVELDRAAVHFAHRVQEEDELVYAA